MARAQEGTSESGLAGSCVETPIIVAELSGNHNGSLDRALDLVRAVSTTGASHVKIQTYTADTITLDVDRPPFLIPEDHPLWGGRSLHALYEEAHTPWSWHEPIFELARELNLIPFSSPFDPSAVDFLESAGVSLYKVASIEIGDLPLIKYIGSTKKPVVISTGAATLSDIDRSVEAATSGGAESVTLLVCTSAYPAAPEDANIRRITTLKDAFGLPVGLSDHTLGIGVSIAATALGASMIEKHVTLSRDDGGVDSAFSAEPDELRQLVRECRNAAISLGSPIVRPTASEDTSLGLRRSLYVTQDVAAGDEASSLNVRSVRPAGGLSPEQIDHVIGLQFSCDAQAGTPVTWDLLTRRGSAPSN